MDKFFASLMIMVFSSLIFATVNMFQNRGDAATIKKGVEIMLENSNQLRRAPSLGSNREVK